MLFDLDNLLSYQNVLCIIAAWFMVTSARKAAPEFFAGDVGHKLLPLMPVLACLALVVFTFKWQPEATWGERVLLGVALGALTSNAHTVLRRFGLQELVPGLRQGDRGFE